MAFRDGCRRALIACYSDFYSEVDKLVDSKIKSEKMTLDEVIKHAEITANECEVKARILETPAFTKKSLERCSKEHRQIAEWLKELKALRKELEQTWHENEVLKAEKDILLTLLKVLTADVDDWIPVSEELPEDNKEVLISCEWGVDIGQYDEDGWRSEWINHYDDDDVLAWQPLPKPYRKDGE